MRGEMPRPASGDAAMRPFTRCGAPVGGGDGDVAVEVGGGEQEFGRRAVREVRDGRGGDVAAPAVFDRHRDAHADAEIARLRRPRQAAQLADLQVDDVHGEVGAGAQQHVEAVDVLVEDERMGVCRRTLRHSS